MTPTNFLKNAEKMLDTLYAGREKSAVISRFESAFAEFRNLYAKEPAYVFSVAGRSEICGNHTDHNHGKVVAASIDLDIIAIVAKTDDNTVKIKSANFPEDIVTLDNLSPVPAERGKSSSLIRGVCDGFTKRNYKIGGFCAYTTSDVMGGSGLSSSAAFEDMVGTILNHLYNGGTMDYVTVSEISQYAENVHFGKPCGLMDQIACAAGGFVAIDFADPKAPKTRKLNLDLSKKGYALCIVNTGGSHANLTDDYAAVPSEMKEVAAYFGKETLRGLTVEDIMANAFELRSKFGDRAILRALHFLHENDRVDALLTAIEKEDMDAFFFVIRASGLSSATLLQNYSTPKAPSEQGISLATAIASEIIGNDGATRVHGGGFAGTAQAFVRKESLPLFKEKMEKVFGVGSVTELSVRPVGACLIYHE